MYSLSLSFISFISRVALYVVVITQLKAELSCCSHWLQDIRTGLIRGRCRMLRETQICDVVLCKDDRVVAAAYVADDYSAACAAFSGLAWIHFKQRRGIPRTQAHYYMHPVRSTFLVVAVCFNEQE